MIVTLKDIAERPGSPPRRPQRLVLMRIPDTIPATTAPAPGARWTRGARLFGDQSLTRLEFLLDEAFRVPGTRIRFGVDGIIGFAPGVGDIIAGLVSLVFPLAGWMRGAPYITLTRMVVNLGIGVLVGSVPLFGDVFDVAWKANRRNYQLLQRHLTQPRRHTWRDCLFLLTMLFFLAAIFAIPIVFFIWLVLWLAHR